MTEDSEVKVNLPLFDEASASLKENGVYKKDLDPNEVSGIMQSIISSFTEGNSQISAICSRPKVIIANGEGYAEGSIDVKRPISADIGVRVWMFNHPEKPGYLKLKAVRINENTHDPISAVALGSLNLQTRAQEQMNNPNKVFGKVLKEQFKQKGVKLTGLGLNFNERNKLSIALSGGKL